MRTTCESHKCTYTAQKECFSLHKCIWITEMEGGRDRGRGEEIERDGEREGREVCWKWVMSYNVHMPRHVAHACPTNQTPTNLCLWNRHLWENLRHAHATGEWQRVTWFGRCVGREVGVSSNSTKQHAASSNNDIWW